MGLLLRHLVPAALLLLPAAPAAGADRTDLYGDPLPPGALARVGTVRFRTGSSVMEVRWSPDGRTLASVGHDAVFLWDARTGKEIRSWRGNPSYYRGAFGPDGKKLWLQTYEGELSAWDLAAEPDKGLRPAPFKGPHHPFLAVSGDHKVLATGSRGAVRLWDLATEKAVREVETGDEAVYEVSLSHDGKTVATKGDSGAVVVWDAAGKELRHFPPEMPRRRGDRTPTDPWVGEFALSPDGNTIAVSVKTIPEGKDTVKLWDTGSGKELRALPQNDGASRALAFSPDGKYLAFGGQNLIQLWEAGTGRSVWEMPIKGNQVFGLEFSPDGRTLATAGIYTVRLWDVATGREMCPAPEYRGGVGFPVLIVTWSYSNAPFAIALPTERTEAVLHGLVDAFTFFGCVPGELWWDNPKTVAVHLFRGRERALHPRYAALASHYVFTPKFCLPATATEKPRVENRVFDLQRRWATPVPRVTDLAELNASLRRCCLAARTRTCGDQVETVGVRFEQDRRAGQPIPERPFDACVVQPGQVDKYQTVRFDGNSYSVPRRWAFRDVSVKGYVDRVAVVAEGQTVAVHSRSYGRHEKILDPLHYLVVLEKKPAALDHAPVYRDWQLPAAFAELRRSLETDLGPRTGPRHYIRVLQLLARHPIERVEGAIGLCRTRGVADAAAVAAATERLARDAVPPSSDTRVSLDLAAVTVPRPDLARFDLLLPRSPQGDRADERRECPAAEGQPQATQAAHHAGRVGETRP